MNKKLSQLMSSLNKNGRTRKVEIHITNYKLKRSYIALLDTLVKLNYVHYYNIRDEIVEVYLSFDSQGNRILSKITKVSSSYKYSNCSLKDIIQLTKNSLKPMLLTSDKGIETQYEKLSNRKGGKSYIKL